MQQVIKENAKAVRLHDLFICFETRTVYKNERAIRLPELSFVLLKTLIMHSPAPLSGQQLLKLVWRGVITGDENVKQRIRILRLALGQSEEFQYIKNKRGAGYYIDGPLLWERAELSNTKVTKRLGMCVALLSISIMTLFWWFKSLSTEINLAPDINLSQESAIRLSTSNPSLAFCLDGFDDYIELPDHDALDITTEDFSVTAWIKTQSLEQRVIIDKRYENQIDTVRGYVMFTEEGRLGFQLADGNGNWYCEHPNGACTTYISNSNVADGLWHHVAVTIDRDDVQGIRFYVDGKPSCIHDPTMRNGSLANDMPLRIGSRSSYLTGLFQGAIGEVAIHHQALSYQEVLAEYQRGNQRGCFSIASKGGIAEEHYSSHLN